MVTSAIRPAEDSDALRWKAMQTAFFRSVDRSFRAPTLAQLRARFAQQNIIAVVSDDAICEIKVDEGRREARVELLLPRGLDASLLFPVLGKALAETWARYPNPRWRIWANFIDGVDENGEPDGGKGECDKWHEFFPDSKVEEQGGGWWIHAAFGEVMGRGTLDG